MLGKTLTAVCAALALTVAAPAFAQQSPSPTLDRQDREFLIEAALSGLAEVQFAQLAQEKAAGDTVKTFAKAMLDDHRKANDRLRQLAQDKGVQLPGALNAADTTRLKALKELSGATFDYRYMGGQEEAHEDAVHLYEEELANGKEPAIQTFAHDTLPTLLNHLMSAKVVSYELARANPRLVQGGLMQTTGSAPQTIVTPNASSNTSK